MIGENIKKRRKSMGLSLSELAERAEISKSYLSNIERNQNDNPSIQVLVKIAHVLKVDLRSLIGIESANELIDKEWVDFIEDLRNLGIEKNNLIELRPIIEFMIWQKEKSGK
ncbi:helix-turn-helix domain-containing protein [Ornithinibacillus halotolerans]|uniref:HTH-type transcriptional regulator SinR n=1 Tax=Ornithinibacillus halotolerans TaxID=1274357 RepID=A0A916W6S6_9BACI|nr:helix-turn-helix transcriptional regulator [Ornithinibacillus halotolerans]GGA72964.1 HTH-type transcriptional regulator SinR [Ornithinibacillus halotolerans]